MGVRSSGSLTAGEIARLRRIGDFIHAGKRKGLRA
jgi:hypothetical protein